MSKSAAKSAWYAVRKGQTPAGVCSAYPDCANATDGVRKRCLSHLTQARASKALYRLRQKEVGQCGASDCHNPARIGRSRCTRCATREKKLTSAPKHLAQVRKYQNGLRLEVLAAYGGVCLCCGTQEEGFLTIDHIHGFDGKGPRRGDHLYQWLKTSGFPEGFRVLCMKCNFALGHSGFCKHSTLTQTIKVLKGDAHNVAARERYQVFKKKVFDAYGGFVCACCGETHQECLSIDHIDNKGAEHRRQVKNLYPWLVRNDFPSGFQVLCMNCNWSKGRYGFCSCTRRNSDGN